jgi:hypothetical protein
VTTHDRQAAALAVASLVLVLSLLANAYLLGQLFVGRAEYAAELRTLNARLDRIEHKLGLDDKLGAPYTGPIER